MTAKQFSDMLNSPGSTPQTRKAVRVYISAEIATIISDNNKKESGETSKDYISRVNKTATLIEERVTNILADAVTLWKTQNFDLRTKNESITKQLVKINEIVNNAISH